MRQYAPHVAGSDLDVVVFGATGVTGRRVAAYLAEQSASTGLRWGAAARDADKLERVLGEDGVEPPVSIAADVGDPESLRVMAERARVVLNLVGPYTLYGRPVIEACVAGGAHYADLTGEIPFVRRMVDAFHDRASAAGVKVVQVCGFEALPADLGVAMAAGTARERHGEEITEVDLRIALANPPGIPRVNDFISGGTFQSLAEAAGDADAACITDPAALVADQELAASIRAVSPITVRPRRAADGSVLAPMAPAAFINPAVIHRSRVLADAPPIRYREGTTMGGSPASLPFRYAAAGALAGLQGAVGALARSSPAVRGRVSGGLKRVLPSSGFGPDADRLEGWRWTLTADALTTGGHTVTVTADGDGHPGYLATARMLGEAGALLAEEGATPDAAGCLTPAAALGTESVARFERARLRFAVR